MGFDLAAAGLVDLFGGLFGAEAAAAPEEIAAIAPEVAGFGADAAAIGADVAAPEIAAGTIGDLGAGAADIGAAADTAAFAAPAADVATADLAGAGVVDTLAAGGGAGLEAAAGGGLGIPVGESASSALAFGAPGAASSGDALGAINAAIGASPSSSLAAGLENPTLALADTGASSGNIAATLGSDVAPDLGTSATAGDYAAETGSLAAPTAASSPSALSTLGSAAKSVITNPAVEMGLPLAFLGYNIAKGPPPLPSAATAAATNAVNLGTANVPAFNAAAAQDLSLAQNFQISPSQTAQLDTWKQNQLNQLYQQIASQGNANPTATSEWTDGVNQINQQYLAQQTQMINQLVQTAFQAQGASTAATSATDATLMQAAQLQIAQDTAYQQAISSALQSFGMVAAFTNLGRGNQPSASA